MCDRLDRAAAAAFSVHAALTLFIQNGARMTIFAPRFANGRAKSSSIFWKAGALELSMCGEFSPIAITT